MADSEDEDSSLNLTGFLFGNINEKGELEDTEILDEVTNVSLQTPEWIIAQKRCAVISVFSIVERMPRKTIRKQQSIQSSQYPYLQISLRFSSSRRVNRNSVCRIKKSYHVDAKG